MISSHIHLIKNVPFFSIKFSIDWFICKPSTIILKFFEKNSMGRIFESRGSVHEISTDFYSENGFELTIYRTINFSTMICGSS